MKIANNSNLHPVQCTKKKKKHSELHYQKRGHKVTLTFLFVCVRRRVEGICVQLSVFLQREIKKRPKRESEEDGVRRKKERIHRVRNRWKCDSERKYSGKVSRG